ncbi:MAG: competence/damage-inducible protein A [Cyanobacteria bacterium J069]|nr:MAG: competence/damage-inducible protein A [Cyanobacteria bacterium J069]
MSNFANENVPIRTSAQIETLGAEIICVGTELLLGEILNSNAQFLAQELAALGIPHYYQTVVGDNVRRVQAAIAIACERARLLIFTGGLGPTPDDLTTEAIADFFQSPLEERPEIINDIAQKYATRGRVMTENNRKQALLPVGAAVLSNRTGTAPGMIWEARPGLIILTFPGVPSEMQVMWREVAVPFLRSRGFGQTPIYSRTLRFWGITESALAEKVAPLFDLTHPTVAPYAGKGEVRLRVSAKAGSEAEAQEAIAPVVAQIQHIAGADCYGQDDDTLATVVGQLLQAAGHTLSVAESCTGGGLGSLLTTVPGSSRYFWGGVISYDNAVKESLLGVNPDDLMQQGAVSSIVAEQMAQGVRSRLHTTWGLSITGIAGPDGGSEEKPVGLVYIGLAGPENQVESHRFLFGASRGREWVRWLSACSALDLLRRRLQAG